MAAMLCEIRRGLLLSALFGFAAGHNGVGVLGTSQVAQAQPTLHPGTADSDDKVATRGWQQPLVSGKSLLFATDEEEPGSAIWTEQDKVNTLAGRQPGQTAAANEQCQGSCLTFHVPYRSGNIKGICNIEANEYSACRDLNPAPRVDAGSPIEYCSSADEAYKTHYHYFVHSMLLSPVLRLKTGIQMIESDDPFSADIVVCDKSGLQKFRHDLRRTAKRQFLIGLDHRDAASANISAEELNDDMLLTFAKQYTLRDQSLFCNCTATPHCLAEEKQVGVPLHLIVLRSIMRQAGHPATFLSLGGVKQILAADGCGHVDRGATYKIAPLIPFWLTVRRGPSFPPFESLPRASGRRIHAAFLGVMRQGAGAGEVYHHRSSLVKELEQIGMRRGWNIVIHQGRMQKNRFEQVLRDTQLFISPFGLGEWSGKDEESVLNGAVLVKPAASWFNAALPIYTPGETCLEVRPDWSDLEEVLANAIENPMKMDRIRMTAYAHASRFIGYARAVQDEAVVNAWGEVVRVASDQRRGEGEVWEHEQP